MPEEKTKPKQKCKCLTPERRGFIDGAWDHASDFSDGSFFAYMDEQRIEVEEMQVYSQDHIDKCKNL